MIPSEQKDSNSKVVKPKDCLQCRLVGSIGLIAGASYMAYQSKLIKDSPKRTFARILLFALGSAGLARLFNMPPFQV